jgi:uncharacterized protein (DUF1499 family)
MTVADFALTSRRDRTGLCSYSALVGRSVCRIPQPHAIIALNGTIGLLCMGCISSRAKIMPHKIQDKKLVLRRRIVSFSFLVLGFVFGTILVTGVSVEGAGSPKFLIHPCPDTPNCVSSRAPAGPRRMPPIQYKGSFEDAQKQLLGIVRSLPRVSVVEDGGNYLKVEVRSAFFSFVDDVEFEFDDAEKLIHFRSASRIGYYDFGVNRRRMETIIREFSGK